MKGSYPKPVYILITILGITLLILNTVLDLTVAAGAAGAGLLAYGANRLIGEWRINNNPEYKKMQEIANQDERLAYIADKSRSVTLIITIFVLAILGVTLLSADQKAYGNACLYIVCGICAGYFIIYQVISRIY